MTSKISFNRNASVDRQMAAIREQVLADIERAERRNNRWLIVATDICLFFVALCTLYLVGVGTLPLLGGLFILILIWATRRYNHASIQ